MFVSVLSARTKREAKSLPKRRSRPGTPRGGHRTETKILNRASFLLCAGLVALAPAALWAQDTKPVESKPAEAKPAESKPGEPKPAEPKAAEPKPAEPKAAEPKPTGAKPAAAKTPESKTPESKPQEKCRRGAVGDIPDSLRVVQDETEGTTFYRHQSSPAGAGDEAFFLYIGKKACEVWLRIRIQFPGTKPTGNVRIRIKADDKSFEFAARHLSQSEGANARGYWYDELVEPDHLLMLFKVAASTHATVRIEGAGGSDEHVVSDKEKQALSIVLGAYHSLGGKVSLGPSCASCAIETAYDHAGHLGTRFHKFGRVLPPSLPRTRGREGTYVRAIADRLPSASGVLHYARGVPRPGLTG